MTGRDLRKKFIRVANLIRFCFRWHQWAKQKYARVIHRFISFAQYYEPNETGESSSVRMVDETARIKAEMMNFNTSFLQNISTNMNKLAIEILKKPKRSNNDLAIMVNTFKNMPHMRYLNRLNPEMLNKVLRCCWLEEYEAKRVIAEQYQTPNCLYIVLSGSLVCTYRTNTERKSSTICLLEKGIYFNYNFLTGF